MAGVLEDDDLDIGNLVSCMFDVPVLEFAIYSLGVGDHLRLQFRRRVIRHRPVRCLNRVENEGGTANVSPIGLEALKPFGEQLGCGLMHDLAVTTREVLDKTKGSNLDY